jgi:WD40 repeat protein
MTPTRLVLAWSVVLVTAGLGGAADLSKIERTIGKEPAYKGKPKYCLLVFGPEAKTRVWLVQDGDTLYVDRNANGDLTEKDERVAFEPISKERRSFKVGDIHDGALTHKLTVMQFRLEPKLIGKAKEFERVERQRPEPWVWRVSVGAERPADDRRPLPRQIGYQADGDGLGFLLFADRPAEAPIIHINGPWTLGLHVMQRLMVGSRSKLQIGIGTQGLGPGTFAFYFPNFQTIPADAYPVADITFPPKTPGEKPIRQKYTLKPWGIFSDRIQVPVAAGEGMARIELSFDAWKDGRVGPATVQVPVTFTDITDSKQIRATLRGHTDKVQAVVFAPNGATVASRTSQGEVKLWDVASAKEYLTLKQPGRVTDLAFLPDGRTLATSWSELFDKDGKTLTGPYRVKDVKAYRGGVKLWDVTTGKERGGLQREPPRCVTEITLSPDGKTLAAEEHRIEGDGSFKDWKRGIALWDVETRKVRDDIPDKAFRARGAGPRAFSPDNKTLAFYENGSVLYWDVFKSRGWRQRVNFFHSLRELAFGSDGETWAGWSEHDGVILWDIANCKEKARLQNPEGWLASCMAFSPNGTTVAVVLYPWESPWLDPWGSLTLDKLNEIVLWDVTMKKKCLTLSGHDGSMISSVALSPDDKLLASGGEDATVKLWDVAPGARSKP